MARDSQVAGGHKANLKNPNTSDESKEHSKQVLGGDYSDDDSHSNNRKGTHSSNSGSSNSRNTQDTEGKNPGNVIGGLKASLKNPNVSDEAKESAKERLGDMDVEV